MAFFSQATVPFTFVQVKEMDARMSPDYKLVDGMTMRIVSEGENGTTVITGIWKTREDAESFFRRLSEITCGPTPELYPVHEILQAQP